MVKELALLRRFNNNNAMFTRTAIHNNVTVGISSNKCQQIWSNDLYNKSKSVARTIHRNFASYFKAE